MKYLFSSISSKNLKVTSMVLMVAVLLVLNVSIVTAFEDIDFNNIDFENIDEITDTDRESVGSDMVIMSDTSYAIVANNRNVSISNSVDVHGDITVVGGDLIIGSSVNIIGDIKVSGDVFIGNSVEIKGSISANGIACGSSVDIFGPVAVTSSSKNIIIGHSVKIHDTLTSKAGLKIGSSSNIKMFLSGDSIEVDGKMYKLGGRVIITGYSTYVGMPFIPKPKSKDVDNGKVTVSVPTTTSNTQKPVKKVNTNSNNGKVTTNAPISNIVAQELEEKVEIGSSRINNKINKNLEKLSEGLKEVENVENAVNEILGGAISAGLSNVDKIVNTEDVDAYVQEVSSADENISNITLSSESVNMDYKTPARLFGFIPTSIKTNVRVAKDKKVDVAFPWYAFLFSKPADEKVIENNISNSIKNSVGQNESELSVQLQAFISNSIISTLRGLFGGN